MYFNKLKCFFSLIFLKFYFFSFVIVEDNNLGDNAHVGFETKSKEALFQEVGYCKVT